MADRIKFILNTSVEYFSISSSTQQDDGAIRDFIENDEITILAATANDQTVSFQHRLPTEETCLLFYKIPQLRTPPPPSNAPRDVPVGILTLEGGLVKSIYNSVLRVYSPHVTKKAEYTPEVENLIETLQSSLGASLGLPQSGIQNVQDEIYFWSQKLSSSPTKSDKEKAKAFIASLEELNQQIRKLDSNSLRSLVDFLDLVHNMLDSIWRLPHNYPQNRMTDLMDIICSILIETCAENLNNDDDVFNISSFHATEMLNEVSDFIGSWLHVCDTLTRLFWPNNGNHTWLGPPHVPQAALAFQQRLNEIKSIKTMYAQVSSIFGDHASMMTTIRHMFIPFKDINVFDVTPFGSKRWKSAMYKLEVMVQPIEEKMALILKSKLHSYLGNPRQVVHIFSKYDSILRRTAVMKHLEAERNEFMHALRLLVKEVKTCIHNNEMPQDNFSISPECFSCRWLKVMEHQIIEISKITHLLEDHEHFKDLDEQIRAVELEIENTIKMHFEQWREQSMELVNNGDLTLKDDKPVVEFEKNGRQLMQVTFKPTLITFCHDVRELENLGFRFPIELRDTAIHARRFVGYARRLQQISTFHNTIGDRMVACQRPIMLQNAMELSRLVQSESVAWNDEDSVNRYVAVLQDAVTALSRDNAYLTAQHEEAKKIVIKLMNVDLLRQGQLWKDEMRRLRDIVITLEIKGYQNLQGFKLHWDYQLYKVLEHQYLTGLADLNHKLPDIHVDIVFRQQELQFLPQREDIILKYYAQLRKFLERPLGFRGLSDQSGNIFKVMVDRNRHRFVGMYNRAEQLFRQLDDVLNLWTPWIALGLVNLDELCSVHLLTWEDWDKNFKACKHFSQQIAKIQSSESRLDCFVINLSPLRTDIEFICRTYWETLANSLRISILEDVSVMQDFLQTSLQVLQNLPLDEMGIAEAGAKYERIMSELPKMKGVLESVERKDTCLAGWCKERVSALATILVQWDQLQPLIENHSISLQRQIDIMRDHVESQMTNLREEADKFEIRWETMIQSLRNSDDYNSQLFRERQQNWTAIKERREQLENDCAKFNIEFHAELRNVFTRIDEKVRQQGQEWEVLEQYMLEFDQIGEEEWTVYRRRPYILTNFLNSWNSKLTDSSNPAATKIRKLMTTQQSALPVLQNLQSDGLTERHWAKVFSMFECSPKPMHDILLKEVLKHSDVLLSNADEIQNMVRQAASEQVVRQALAELEQWGATATLKTTTHTDSSGAAVTLIKDFQDVLNKNGDNQCLLQSAKNSSAFGVFTDQADIWEGRLASVDYVLSGLNQIQRKWIYLEPIFSNGTLTSDEASFKRIDKEFRYIMREISNDARVLSVIKINNVTTIIDSLENQLSRCQNTLTSFITTKRNAFPRFYFLADDDLLELLGQSTKSDVIQKHIGKLFPGISALDLHASDSIAYIKSICSNDGDVIQLKNKVSLSIAIEEWLNQLVLEIKFTLIDLMVECSKHERFTVNHVRQYPVQVLCTAKAITFTRQTEKAIASMSMASHLHGIRAEIAQYSSMEYRNTDALTQLKLRSLLLDVVHHASVVEYLMAESVTTVTDWCWLQQLKFYLNAQRLVTIVMVYAEFDYSYEYLGNTNKLVNTELTHNCYLTLTQAMHLGMGGNPFGPAGTGKTECVKSLGAMMGRLVLVFNCSENVDTKAMSLILSGLSRCGAWGCFDEFNRLQEATLSSISMLIQPLQTAIKEKQSTVQLGNESIPLNSHCGIFVTLNPAGEEYGGRQQLPANLQALFRPIVMQQPQPMDIARVMLFAEGFRGADDIGRRLVEVFNLAGEMLSPQRHYDWGLRELKTVLLACGKNLNEAVAEALDDEMEVAVHALRSNTMSKLNDADCRIFDMLVGNVFPSVALRQPGNEQLRQLIEESFATLGLQSNEAQVEKCLQLYEQLNKRTGVVVLGPPGSGKTTIVSVLKQALSAWSKIIRTYTIAPKSMTRVQLLGNLDPDTRQWNDGVLTTTAVAVNSEPANITSWIICDGDVDPEWIEALNSVLDDNKLLTLPSGWRIQFGSNVNFIFETHDLSHASPATISRMGIITLSAASSKESEIIESWLQKQSTADVLGHLVDQYFAKCIHWIDSLGHRQTSRVGLIQCGLQLLQNCGNKDEFCVGLVRGLGSTLQHEDLNRFCLYVFELADLYVANKATSELCFYNAFRHTIDSYDTDDVSTSAMATQFTVQLIRTGQMKVYLDVLRNFLRDSENPTFLLVGPSGSGKSLLLENALSEFSGYQLVTISCSTQLTADFVLYILKQNCLVISGIRGREYRAKFTKTVLYFKNINLCNLDAWGTSEIVELLLQITQRKGFYAPDTLEWIGIVGLQICSSIANTDQKLLSPRFLSAARHLVMRYPSEKDMHVIIRHQMMPVSVKFNVEMRKMENVVNAIISIYTSCLHISNSTPNAHKNQYMFSPKVITTFIAGLMHYPGNMLQQAFYTEMNCIFRNRFMSADNVHNFDSILLTNMQQLFQIDDNVWYFVPEGANTADLSIVNSTQWADTVQKNITICGTEDIHLEIPVTTEFLYITAAICRALSRPETNLILCGATGSGRKEALHVACTGLHIKIITLTPIVNYSLADFYNDLRIAIQSAALDQQSIALHVDHAWISYLPDLMRPIEALLEGSEIPDLFEDDIETLANPLRKMAQLEGYQESIVSYFWQKVKSNLHVVLTLEGNCNVSELFNQYPCLYRNAEMFFVQRFSEATLQRLPQSIFQLTRNQTEELVVPFAFEQLTGNWSISPLRYRQLIKTYIYVYDSFLRDIDSQMVKLKAGVDKLSAAHSVVDVLKVQAQSQEVALAEKKTLANQALEMISTTMRNANEQRTDLLGLKQKTQESSEKLMERKRAIELELKDVEPILQQATAAVGQIKGEALSEIRSLRAPPEIIRDILEGVLRLMGIRDTSWNNMKSFLAKRGVKEDIRSLDPVCISPENCQSVEKLLHTKSESFEQKNAKRASAAAAPLASWVVANVKYSKVIQSIKPLEREQQMLQRNLQESEDEMKSLITGLDDVDARVKELSGQLNMYTQEAAVLEIKLNDARNTLTAAEVLVEKLNAEYYSWKQQMESLNQDLQYIDKKSYLISLSITHLSHYTHDQRKSHLSRPIADLTMGDFDLSASMLTDQDKIVWQSIGLPADVQSMENAAILAKMIQLPFGTAPMPLILDPSGNACRWLQAYLTLNAIPHEIATQNADRFTNALELAVRFGKCLLVQDYQLMKPPLLSIIFGTIHSRFNKKLMQVGNKLIDLHESFSIVLISKMNHIEMGPDVAAYVTAIPFSTTASGYTDELMSRAIQLKQPDLDIKRVNLLQNEGKLLKQRANLQDKLLQELSAATGDILKNEVLLATLNEVKQSSVAIDLSISESSQVRTKLMEEYTQYQDVCKEAANLFVGISGIYNMSVDAFTTLFLRSIGSQEDFVQGNALSQLAKITFTMLSRSISKADHSMLGLHVCRNAFPQKLPNTEWELFITNFVTDDDVASIPAWIPSELAVKVSSLKHRLPSLYAALDFENATVWSAFVDNPKTPEIPAKITEFQKVLITQILQPDDLLAAISRCTVKLLGLKGVSVTKPNIQQISEANTKDQPILLIATGDIDPSKEIQDYVNVSIGNDKYIELSVGKGQEAVTLAAVRKAAKDGSWICLKNIHLVSDWLPTLNESLGSIQMENSFRLWLICASTAAVPESLLVKCNRIMYESPSGVRQKLHRLLQQWYPIVSPQQNATQIRLYLALFILNAVLQERRAYIPQGWTKWYDFGDSDLRTAIAMLAWIGTKSARQKPDWTVLRGLCGSIAYGGRISNRQDHSILAVHLEEFFKADTLSKQWSPLQLRLVLPQSQQLSDYLNAVAQLPEEERPELLGLSPTTNVSRDRIVCRNLLKKLRNIHFSSDDNESFEKRLRPILSMWKKSYSGTTIVKTFKTIDKLAVHNRPWDAFVVGELQLAAQIVQLIHTTLVMLHVAIKDMAAIQPQDKELLAGICENQVPVGWRKLWSGPRAVMEFIRGAMGRATAAEQRYRNAYGGAFGERINFADIYNLDGYIAALKLTNANELKKSTCDLTLTSSLCSSGDERLRSLTSPIVETLLLDGAALQDNKLVLLDKVALTLAAAVRLPAFQIRFDIVRPASAANDMIELPLYSNSSREHLVCTLKLSTTVEKEAIILSGVALIVPDVDVK